MKWIFVRPMTTFVAAMAMCLSMSGASLAQNGEQPTGAAGAGQPAIASQTRGNIQTPKVEPFEQWTTPLLDGSKLRLVDALPLEVDDANPFFTFELVRVMWRPGDPIDLYISRPVGVKNPPVILYLYDYPFESDRLMSCDFCAPLARSGVATVGFAPALTGQRYHDRPMKEWFVSELPEALATTAHDVQMILNYLDTRKDVDTSHTAMYAEGSGATVAILAAAVDSRIRTLDLVTPWGNWPEWMASSTLIPEKERPNFLKPEYLAQVALLDPVKWLRELKTQKVRLRNVKAFPETPLTAQQKIEAAAPPNVEVVHYDDAKALQGADPPTERLTWATEQLRPTASREYRANGGGSSLSDGIQKQR